MMLKLCSVFAVSLLVATSVTLGSEHFDIDRAASIFESAAADSNAISLAGYADGFKEIRKMFKNLGVVFGFVDDELKSCIEQLEWKNVDKDPTYKSVQSAIEHEIGQNSAADSKSATRAISKLQGALEFLINFMSRLSEMSENGDASYAAREAYSDTLGRKHSFAIRLVAGFALRSMPRKRNLMSDVLGDSISKLSERNLNDKISKFTIAMDNLYKSVHKFYESKNL